MKVWKRIDSPTMAVPDSGDRMDPYHAPRTSPGDAAPVQSARKRKLHSLNVLAVIFAIFMVSLVWMSLSCCACGHAGVATLLVLLPASLATVFVLRPWRQCYLSPLIVSVFLALLVGVMAIKSVVDVLWTGHEPLLGRGAIGGRELFDTRGSPSP